MNMHGFHRNLGFGRIPKGGKHDYFMLGRTFLRSLRNLSPVLRDTVDSGRTLRLFTRLRKRNTDASPDA